MGLPLASPSTTKLPADVEKAARVRVVTRGDDAASSISANRAIREACEAGILRNVSVMVPGPYLQDAFERLGHLHDSIAFGLHVCLTSEWEHPRWGPVAPLGDVRSLVGADGYFPRTCGELQTQGALPSEMMLEVKAQLDAMRAAGFAPVYMDEHMGVGWIGGLATELHELARQEGLIFRPSLKSVSLPAGVVREADYATALLDYLRVESCGNEKPGGRGPYLIVGHPVYDDPETRSIRSASHADGVISTDRVGQRMMFLRDDVKDYFGKYAEAIRYDQI